jgi:hypothetical protein
MLLSNEGLRAMGYNAGNDEIRDEGYVWFWPKIAAA